jgi:DMSO/TMAO reductase YedYZ molybdopterin-dependent catalytic subunit
MGASGRPPRWWQDGGVTDASEPPRPGLPPGQKLAKQFPVLHYGPVPRFKPDSWRLVVNGATADGCEQQLDVERFAELPRVSVHADLHCVTRWTVLGISWEGVSAQALMAAVPPADDVTHVMAWAEYGYSANLRIEDFAASGSILATHRDGEPLTPDHGYPLRLVVPHLYAWKGPKWLRGIEYLTTPRRGFWEERGYHTVGDPWQEERYSYQE